MLRTWRSGGTSKGMLQMDPTLMAYTGVVFMTALLIGVIVCVGGKSAQDTGTSTGASTGTSTKQHEKESHE